MQKILIALVCLGVMVSFAAQADEYDRNIDDATLKQMELDRGPTFVREYQLPSWYPKPGGRAWLIEEYFETGMPGDWTIVNVNGDLYTWTTGTTSDLHTYTPPDYGTAYAYYSDDDAGSGAAYGNEYLITPAKYCGDYAAMELDYCFGYDHISTREWATVEVRFHNGSAWGSWTQLAYYSADTAGAQRFGLNSYLPADSVQVQFVYNEPGPYSTWAWAYGIDNVFLGTAADHDVACTEVVSPPYGLLTPGNYNVTGHIVNNGTNAESFWVHGIVYDTDGMVELFNDSVYVSSFPVGGDQNVTVGTYAFPDETYFLTEVYTGLDDENNDNNLASVESRTAPGLGDIVFELDVSTPSGDPYLLGVEFDGEYFYVTGAYYFVYALVHVFTADGTYLGAFYQMPWCHGSWGWRDLADDADGHHNASMTYYVDQFDIDVPYSLTFTGSFPGPCGVQRAMAYDPENDVYFTGDFSDYVFKWNKDWSVLEYNTNPDLWAMYGAAYDTDYDEGGWVWWHSQDGPYPAYLQVEQMDAATMTFTGLNFNYVPLLQTWTSYAVAGGACFYEGWDGYDVLFTLVQGDPDEIVGIIVRRHIPVADATIDFDPATLNLGSGGQGVKCFIELEEGFDIYDIDLASVRIEKIDGTAITPVYCTGTGTYGDYDSDGIPDVMVTFPRADLIAAMEGIVIPPAYADLYVRGDLTGADFAGAATIRVINPQTKHDGYMSNDNIPVAFALSEISPNPFNSRAQIRYALPTPAHVNATIYDASGRVVKGLINSTVEAGYHNIYWDGHDDAGRTVSSGVYFLKFDAADYNATQKLLFVR